MIYDDIVTYDIVVSILDDIVGQTYDVVGWQGLIRLVSALD